MRDKPPKFKKGSLIKVKGQFIFFNSDRYFDSKFNAYCYKISGFGTDRKLAPYLALLDYGVWTINCVIYASTLENQCYQHIVRKY